MNENDLVTVGGYPGELRNLLGIWAEELDVLFPDQKNKIVIEKPFTSINGSYECGMLCDLIHLEGAKALALTVKIFIEGGPHLQ